MFRLFALVTVFCLVPFSISAAPEGAVLELIKQARKAHAAGDFDEAIRLYSAARERDKDEDEAYYGRALAYLAKRDTGKALADINTAIKISPDENAHLALRA